MEGGEAAAAPSSSSASASSFQPLSTSKMAGTTTTISSCPPHKQTDRRANELLNPQHSLLTQASSGNVAGVAGALSSGAHVDSSSPCHLQYPGRAALHHAASKGHVSVVRFLVQRGANVNLHSGFPGDRGATPAHLAAENGYYRSLQVLLFAGANPDRPDADGRLPIHRAALRRQVWVLRAMWDFGCDLSSPAADYSTALHLAAGVGALNVARFLVEVCGVRPGVTDGEGFTALHHPNTQRHPRLVAYLREVDTVMEAASRWNPQQIAPYPRFPSRPTSRQTRPFYDNTFHHTQRYPYQNHYGVSRYQQYKGRIWYRKGQRERFVGGKPSTVSTSTSTSTSTSVSASTSTSSTSPAPSRDTATQNGYSHSELQSPREAVGDRQTHPLTDLKNGLGDSRTSTTGGGDVMPNRHHHEASLNSEKPVQYGHNSEAQNGYCHAKDTPVEALQNGLHHAHSEHSLLNGHHPSEDTMHNGYHPESKKEYTGTKVTPAGDASKDHHNYSDALLNGHHDQACPPHYQATQNGDDHFMHASTQSPEPWDSGFSHPVKVSKEGGEGQTDPPHSTQDTLQDGHEVTQTTHSTKGKADAGLANQSWLINGLGLSEEDSEIEDQKVCEQTAVNPAERDTGKEMQNGLVLEGYHSFSSSWEPPLTNHNSSEPLPSSPQQSDPVPSLDSLVSDLTSSESPLPSPQPASAASMVPHLETTTPKDNSDNPFLAGLVVNITDTRPITRRGIQDPPADNVSDSRMLRDEVDESVKRDLEGVSKPEEVSVDDDERDFIVTSDRHTAEHHTEEEEEKEEEEQCYGEDVAEGRVRDLEDTGKVEMRTVHDSDKTGEGNASEETVQLVEGGSVETSTAGHEKMKTHWEEKMGIENTVRNNEDVTGKYSSLAEDKIEIMEGKIVVTVTQTEVTNDNMAVHKEYEMNGDVKMKAESEEDNDDVKMKAESEEDNDDGKMKAESEEDNDNVKMKAESEEDNDNVKMKAESEEDNDNVKMKAESEEDNDNVKMKAESEEDNDNVMKMMENKTGINIIITETEHDSDTYILLEKQSEKHCSINEVEETAGTDNKEPQIVKEAEESTTTDTQNQEQVTERTPKQTITVKEDKPRKGKRKKVTFGKEKRDNQQKEQEKKEKEEEQEEEELQSSTNSKLQHKEKREPHMKGSSEKQQELKNKGSRRAQQIDQDQKQSRSSSITKQQQFQSSSSNSEPQQAEEEQQEEDLEPVMSRKMRRMRKREKGKKQARLSALPEGSSDKERVPSDSGLTEPEPEPHMNPTEPEVSTRKNRKKGSKKKGASSVVQGRPAPHPAENRNQVKGATQTNKVSTKGHQEARGHKAVTPPKSQQQTTPPTHQEPQHSRKHAVDGEGRTLTPAEKPLLGDDVQVLLDRAETVSVEVTDGTVYSKETVQAEDTERTVQAEDTERTVQAEDTQRTVQAEDTERTVQTEDTQRTVQAEDTERTVQAEDTERTVQAEDIERTVPAEVQCPVSAETEVTVSTATEQTLSTEVTTPIGESVPAETTTEAHLTTPKKMKKKKKKNRKSIAEDVLEGESDRNSPEVHTSPCKTHTHITETYTDPADTRTKTDGGEETTETRNINTEIRDKELINIQVTETEIRSPTTPVGGGGVPESANVEKIKFFREREENCPMHQFKSILLMFKMVSADLGVQKSMLNRLLKVDETRGGKKRPYEEERKEEEESVKGKDQENNMKKEKIEVEEGNEMNVDHQEEEEEEEVEEAKRIDVTEDKEQSKATENISEEKEQREETEENQGEIMINNENQEEEKETPIHEDKNKGVEGTEETETGEKQEDDYRKQMESMQAFNIPLSHLEAVVRCLGAVWTSDWCGKDVGVARRGGNVCYALQEALKAFQSCYIEDKATPALLNLKAALQECGCGTSWRAQVDECLLSVLTSVHHSLYTSAANALPHLNMAQRVSSEVMDVFGGVEECRFVCEEKGVTVSRSRGPFLVYGLTVPPPGVYGLDGDLQDRLLERCRGPQVKWECPFCHVSHTCRCHVHLARPPKVLLIYLCPHQDAWPPSPPPTPPSSITPSPSSSPSSPPTHSLSSTLSSTPSSSPSSSPSSNGRRKRKKGRKVMQKAVMTPAFLCEDLDLTQLLLPRSNKSAHYTLKAIVSCTSVDISTTLTSAPTAYVKEDSGSWWGYRDGEVAKISTEEVLHDSQARLLFYKARDVEGDLQC